MRRARKSRERRGDLTRALGEHFEYSWTVVNRIFM